MRPILPKYKQKQNFWKYLTVNSQVWNNVTSSKKTKNKKKTGERWLTTPIKNADLTNWKSERWGDHSDFVEPSIYESSIYIGNNVCVLNIFMIYSFESTRSDLAMSDQAFSSKECISLPISLAGKSKNADKSGIFLIFLSFWADLYSLYNSFKTSGSRSLLTYCFHELHLIPCGHLLYKASSQTV